jgi:hypothetical protein
MAAVSVNSALVQIVQSLLVPEFRQHGRHPGRSRYHDGKLIPADYDPWWWPVDPANSHAHWGLTSSQDWEFQSLCRVPRTGKEYESFGGSLGAEPGCVVVVGERPSFNDSYASAIRHLRVGLDLLRASTALTERLGGPPMFHITDLVKFRGMSFRDNLADKMLDISARCLEKEFVVLRPKIVLLTDMAEKRLREVDDRLGRNTPVVGLILNHPMLVRVPHWSRAGSSTTWVTAIG